MTWTEKMSIEKQLFENSKLSDRLLTYLTTT
jgi:hypothetical protein